LVTAKNFPTLVSRSIWVAFIVAKDRTKCEFSRDSFFWLRNTAFSSSGKYGHPCLATCDS
jgi:hypothetical protein